MINYKPMFVIVVCGTFDANMQEMCFGNWLCSLTVVV
jgi:hypothetical protein